MNFDTSRELDYLVGHDIANVTLAKGLIEKRYSHVVTDNGRWIMLENIGRGPLKFPVKIGIGTGGYGHPNQTWATELCDPNAPSAASVGMERTVAVAACSTVVQNDTDILCTATFTNTSAAAWNITEAALITDSDITIALLCSPMIGSAFPFTVNPSEIITVTWTLSI